MIGDDGVLSMLVIVFVYIFSFVICLVKSTQLFLRFSSLEIVRGQDLLNMFGLGEWFVSS